jgi:hypothetical protein
MDHVFYVRMDVDTNYLLNNSVAEGQYYVEAHYVLKIYIRQLIFQFHQHFISFDWNPRHKIYPS